MHVAACVERSEDVCRGRDQIICACCVPAQGHHARTVSFVRAHRAVTRQRDGPVHDSYGTRSRRSDRNRRPTGAMAWLWHPKAEFLRRAKRARSREGPFGCNGAMVKRWRRATSSFPHIRPTVRLLAHCARYSWPATRPIEASVPPYDAVQGLRIIYTRHRRLFVPSLRPAIGSATARRNQPSRCPHYVGRWYFASAGLSCLGPSQNNSSTTSALKHAILLQLLCISTLPCPDFLVSPSSSASPAAVPLSASHKLPRRP